MEFEEDIERWQDIVKERSLVHTKSLASLSNARRLVRYYKKRQLYRRIAHMVKSQYTIKQIAFELKVDYHDIMIVSDMAEIFGEKVIRKPKNKNYNEIR